MDNDISSEGLIQSSSGNGRNALLITLVNSSVIYRCDENEIFLFMKSEGPFTHRHPDLGGYLKK